MIQLWQRETDLPHLTNSTCQELFKARLSDDNDTKDCYNGFEDISDLVL